MTRSPFSSTVRPKMDADRVASYTATNGVTWASTPKRGTADEVEVWRNAPARAGEPETSKLMGTMTVAGFEDPGMAILAALMGMARLDERLAHVEPGDA